MCKIKKFIKNILNKLYYVYKMSGDAYIYFRIEVISVHYWILLLSLLFMSAINKLTILISS